MAVITLELDVIIYCQQGDDLQNFCEVDFPQTTNPTTIVNSWNSSDNTSQTAQPPFLLELGLVVVLVVVQVHQDRQTGSHRRISHLESELGELHNVF